MSKNLEHWLEWATTETHVPVGERAKHAVDRLHDDDQPLWQAVVDCAATFVVMRADSTERVFDTQLELVAWCLEHHPAAFRDLCLEFARAVEKMHQVVPEAVAEPEPVPPIVFYRGADFGYDAPAEAAKVMRVREYLASWIGPGAAKSLEAIPPGSSGFIVDGKPWPPRDTVTEVRAVGTYTGPCTVKLVEPVPLPSPEPTPFGNGSDMRDTVCGCGRYIIRPGKIWAAAEGGYHATHACSRALPLPPAQ